MEIQLLEPEAFPPAAIAQLQQIGDVVIGDTAEDTSQVEAVFIRLANRIDAAFHVRYPALRWIVSPTTGLNHIDLDYFARTGVEVLSLRGRTDFLDRIRATSEHTLAMVLALMRKLPAADRAVRAGQWDRYPHKGRELHGKTVLVYGYGRIGRQVAALYEAFGCRVLAYDVIEDRVPECYRCTWPDALAETDILSVHLSLHNDTTGLIDAALLARLPGTAVLVNTSRGEIIDQEQLFTALERGALAGAALDVLHGEPTPTDPGLLRRIEALGDKLVVTPHIGGFTFESLKTVEEFISRLFIDAVHAQT